MGAPDSLSQSLHPSGVTALPSVYKKEPGRSCACQVLFSADADSVMPENCEVLGTIYPASP